jgi:uroporphyrinogen-III synthase
VRTPLRPLEGLRVLVTRPRSQNRQISERLKALGAEPVAVPTIGIVPPRAGGPLDQALRTLEDYDWVIVTSANGARACLGRARALKVDLAGARVRWAAIGPATAGELREAGIAVAMTPSRFITDAIASEWPGGAGQRVLLPRTDAAPPGLAEALRARGATVDEITAYRTVLAPVRSRAKVRRLVTAHEVDAVVFTSASTVHGLVRLLGDDRAALAGIEIACIGPVTAAAVTEEGFSPSVVAQRHTVEDLLDALVARHQARAAHMKGDRHARDRAAR